MKTRFSFESKIIAFMLIIFLIVSITGFLTYQQFMSVVNQTGIDKTENSAIILSEELLNLLNTSENAVKSYSITKDKKYYDKFKQNQKNVITKQQQLNVALSKQDSVQQLLVGLDTSINNKFLVLTDLLYLQDQFRVEQALNKVFKEIKDASYKLDDVIDKESELTSKEQKRFFKRLFKRKKRKLTNSKLDKQTQENQISIAEVENEVSEVKNEEKYIETLLKENELALIIEDSEITIEIRQILDQIKTAQFDLIKQRNLKLSDTMSKTNQQIAYFCISIVILITIMSYIIFSYSKNNRKSKHAMKLAQVQAEELAKTKERFLANMSHELRTPMNSIVGFIEQIEQGNLNPKQREHISMVKKSSEHLIYLINDVLDFTKLQTGKLQLEKIGFEPQKVINDCIEFTRPLAEGKNILFEKNIDSNVPPILLGDPTRLKQILLNLLSNAIKFTPKGKITLNLKSSKTTHGLNQLQIELIDTGIGMDENQLAKVFQEFEQAEVSTARDYGGTGLGLSITKMLVELHQGDINISSKRNIGTQVNISLPYSKGNKEDIPQSNDFSNKLIDFSNLNILIVDDEAFNRKLLLSILEKYNAKLSEAKNGLEALEQAQMNQFDLILMDIRMPKMNGIDASKEIRQMNGKKGTTPIIALTAAVLKEDIEKYRAAEINDQLAKPFNEFELIEIIQKALNREILEIKQDKETSDDPTQPISFANLKSTSGNDISFYQSMLEIFNKSSDESFANILNHFNQGNLSLIAEEAHKMAPPCKHLKAENLYSKLKELESIIGNKVERKLVKSKIEEVQKELKIVSELVSKELDRLKKT